MERRQANKKLALLSWVAGFAHRRQQISNTLTYADFMLGFFLVLTLTSFFLVSVTYAQLALHMHIEISGHKKASLARFSFYGASRNFTAQFLVGATFFAVQQFSRSFATVYCTIYPQDIQ